MKFFIALIASVTIGLILELLSLSSYLEPFRPHFLLMITVSWAHATGKQFSIGSAWLIGLLLDIALISPLGLNALVFVIATYITKRNRKWLRKLNLSEISIAFGGFYILQIVLSLVINNMLGATTEFNFLTFGSVILSMLLWPLIYALLSDFCNTFKISDR